MTTRQLASSSPSTDRRRGSPGQFPPLGGTPPIHFGMALDDRNVESRCSFVAAPQALTGAGRSALWCLPPPRFSANGRDRRLRRTYFLRRPENRTLPREAHELSTHRGTARRLCLHSPGHAQGAKASLREFAHRLVNGRFAEIADNGFRSTAVSSTRGRCLRATGTPSLSKVSRSYLPTVPSTTAHSLRDQPCCVPIGPGRGSSVDRDHIRGAAGARATTVPSNQRSADKSPVTAALPSDTAASSLLGSSRRALRVPGSVRSETSGIVGSPA